MSGNAPRARARNLSIPIPRPSMVTTIGTSATTTPGVVATSSSIGPPGTPTSTTTPRRPHRQPEDTRRSEITMVQLQTREQRSSTMIGTWPEEAREAAQLVIDQYGEPDEITETQLVWHQPGPWKRIVASKAFYRHHFPAPHIDAVESVIDYRVPPDKVTQLAEFDGSVIVGRTAGEVSARCHDEHANFLAFNLMH